jgi:hypothetical protein
LLDRSAVLADQAANDLPALDPGGDIDGLAGLPLRGFLLQGLVRTMLVIVPGVLDQDLAEMPFAEDQHVVQALAAQRAHEPLRVGIRSRRPDRRLDHPRAVPGEDFVECGGELAVPVADQEFELPGPFAEVRQEVAGLLDCPGGYVNPVRI